MKSNYSLSIVIPVYNGATCIGACLDSILHQKGADKFQIIVVNDGSSDNTASIVQNYRINYPNITLLNQKNSGVSVARNAGINMANGDYITFVDADDLVGLKYSAYRKYFTSAQFNRPVGNLCVSHSRMPTDFKSHTFCDNFFTNLLRVANTTDAEVVLGGKVTFNHDQGYIRRHVYHQQKIFGTSSADKDTVLKQADCRENANFCLYSKKMLDKNKLYFVKGMQLDEDMLFCMLACLYAQRVATVPDVTYLYNRHENSLSNATNHELSNRKYALANVQRFSKLLVELSKYPEYSSIYTHWLQVFSHECNKVPDSEYFDRFPPRRCERCPFDKCDSDCWFCTGPNSVLIRLQENVRTLIR